MHNTGETHHRHDKSHIHNRSNSNNAVMLELSPSRSPARQHPHQQSTAFSAPSIITTTATTTTPAAANTPHSSASRPKRKRVVRQPQAIDLAFPSVVINTSSIKAKRRRHHWHMYRMLAGVALCLVLLVHFIDRTMLRLPTAETRLDFSHVSSASELSVDAIDSWCFVEEHDACHCSNPLIPEGRQEDPRWEMVHHYNVDAFQNALQTYKHYGDSLDVIFLGDSIMEGWTGRYYHQPDPRAHGAKAVFESYFVKRQGGTYNALPQGISGDFIPNLLWRIQNGEIGRGAEEEDEDELLLQDTNPQQQQQSSSWSSNMVFWILIGTNDLGRTNCSPDMIIVGIIRIVEELKMRQPSATIVINGLLPRTFDDHSGFLMQSQGKLPILWPMIQTINAELKRYADQRGDTVHYFETNVFLTNHTAPNAELRINKELMTDCLHPSAEGYRRWAKDIVATLDAIKNQPPK